MGPVLHSCMGVVALHSCLKGLQQAQSVWAWVFHSGQTKAACVSSLPLLHCSCDHTRAVGDLMIAANKGASPGWLVPLSAGLCYVGKPGSFMSSSSISKVLFHRAGGSSSTFDITIKLRPAAVGGGAAAKPLELGQIDAAELNKLQGYLMMQRIKVRS